MDHLSKQTIHLPDGRLADKLIQIAGDKTITEIFAEPKVEKKLSQRIIETNKSVIVKREIEELDEAGNVLSRKVESEPEPKLELREHITANCGIEVLSTKEDCNCYVTQEDLSKAITTAAETIVAAFHSDPIAIAEQTNTVREQFLSMAGKANWQDNLLWIGIAAAAGVFVWIQFFW